MCSKLSALSTHTCFESCMPLVNGCVSNALLNAALYNVLQALSQNIPVMLNDVISVEKIVNKLKINLLNRNNS